MPGVRMLLLITVIGLVVAVLQVFIWRLSKDNTFFKYIPTIVLALIAVICVIKAVWFSTGMEDLAYFVTAMLVAGVFVISLITGIVIDIVVRLKRR